MKRGYDIDIVNNIITLSSNMHLLSNSLSSLANLNNIIVFSIIIIIDKFLLVVRESGMFIVMIL